MPKKERTYANFGEYLFWSYANLQMLFVALKEGKPRYDRLCFMIRAKAFKAYKDGRWNIHDLFEFNIEKIRNNNYCWYCGQKVEPSKLTKDHVFPRSKGGANEIDNIIMVCKSCNSSKGIPATKSPQKQQKSYDFCKNICKSRMTFVILPHYET